MGGVFGCSKICPESWGANFVDTAGPGGREGYDARSFQNLASNLIYNLFFLGLILVGWGMMRVRCVLDAWLDGG